MEKVSVLCMNTEFRTAFINCCCLTRRKRRRRRRRRRRQRNRQQSEQNNRTVRIELKAFNTTPTGRSLKVKYLNNQGATLSYMVSVNQIIE